MKDTKFNVKSIVKEFLDGAGQTITLVVGIFSILLIASGRHIEAIILFGGTWALAALIDYLLNR